MISLYQNIPIKYSQDGTMTQTRAKLLFGTAFLLLRIATYKVYQPICSPLRSCETARTAFNSPVVIHKKSIHVASPLTFDPGSTVKVKSRTVCHIDVPNIPASSCVVPTPEQRT